MSARNDVHKPSSFMPVDYKFVLWYACTSQSGPSVNVNCELDKVHDFNKRHYTEDGRFQCVHDCPRREHTSDRCCVVRAHFAQSTLSRIFGGVGKCGVCGANYVHGELWQHRSGDLVHLGHDCADKYGIARDRSDWIAWHKKQSELRSRARREMRFKKAALEFLDKNAGLRDCFDLVTAWDDVNRQPLHEDVITHTAPVWTADHGCPKCHELYGHDGINNFKAVDEPFGIRVLRDMEAKLNQYGSLSEKQLAFAAKLADELRNPKPEPAPEAHVIAPVGKTTVTGEIVSAKVHEGSWGSTWKMTVKVTTPNGTWLVWTTIPQSLYDIAYKATESGGCALQWLRGKQVTFVATLERGKEAHFVFGKRPSRVALVG